jgi:Putative adhesin
MEPFPDTLRTLGITNGAQLSAIQPNGGIAPMKRLFSRRAICLALPIATLIAAGAFVAPSASAEEWNKSYTVSGRAQVRAETNDGAVQIFTGDSKQVEFRVTYNGYELDKNLHIDSHQDGDSVAINARVQGHWGFSWGGHNRGLKIEVHMPKDADVQVDTGDGSVTMESLNGRVKIHTGDGSVRADQVAGDVDIDTGDGSITVSGAKGDIRLRTGDGHIEARNLDGKVDAYSGDGHITLEGRLDGLNVKTGDGSIDARIRPGSKIDSGWSIRTGDGSVDVTLPGELQANIEASTNDGHITMGIPLTVEGTFSTSQLHGKMNGGGQPIVIHTGDGSIRLSKA